MSDEPRRRQPRQTRSRVLVEAILDAAARALAAEGPHVTTNRIAERAGVSVGSLYQYFPNKQALFTALGERYVERLRTAMAEAARSTLGAPRAEVLPGVLQHILQVSSADPLLSGMLHVTAIPAPAFAPIVAFERDAEIMAAAFLQARPDLAARPLPDPTLTAKILIRALGGVVGRTLATEPTLVLQPAFVRELLHVAYGLLGWGARDPG